MLRVIKRGKCCYSDNFDSEVPTNAKHKLAPGRVQNLRMRGWSLQRLRLQKGAEEGRLRISFKLLS
jgi:hypothetical protein